MLNAKSMYLGGEIVVASDIESYDQPKQLGLICPFCNEAVFLRASGTRTKHGKAEFINAHFSHYKGDAISDCERRSRSIEGKAKIEALKAIARNQRLTLYNRYLWDMLMDGRGATSKVMNTLIVGNGKKRMKDESTAMRRVWNGIKDVMYQAVEYTYEGMSSISIDDLTRLDSRYDSKAKAAVIDQSIKLSKIDKIAHLAVCMEVVDYLGSFTASNLFEKLYIICYSTVCVQLDRRPKLTSQDDFEQMILNFATAIARVDWIEQINKRQNQPVNNLLALPSRK